MDDERKAASARGGSKRWAVADPAEVAATRRAAAAAVNSPAALARRLARRWPDLSRADRAEIRAILEPLMPRTGRKADSRRSVDVSP